MKLQDFKKGILILSGQCENTEDLTQKISSKVYYNSKMNLTMFSENNGVKFFYMVNFKGEINQNKIVRVDANNKYQYRYFN
jgi:hypothetical protein